jgi:signal transduction histidine kinase
MTLDQRVDEPPLVIPEDDRAQAGSALSVNERHTLQMKGNALDRAADLGRDLLRSETPAEAVRVAARYVSEALDVPLAAWLPAGDTARMRLISVRGAGRAGGQRLRAEMAMLPKWSGLFPVDREAILRRFAEAVSCDAARPVVASHALLIVALAEDELRPVLDLVASLLGEALRQQAVVSLAERRNEQLDLSIAWTAHELTSPVLGVKAVLELLIDDERRDESHHSLLRRSLHELDVLAGTTEGLLGYAAGAQPLRPRWVDVVAIVEEAAASSALRSDDRRVVVRATSPAMAEVDPDQLRTAISNLIRNAVSCSPRGTTVEVAVERREDQVLISVSDEGPGIAESDRADIFDPFVRGAVGVARRGGAGLGLFITRRVVESHDGDVWIDPYRRDGTTFHVRVPVAAVGTVHNAAR